MLRKLKKFSLACRVIFLMILLHNYLRYEAMQRRLMMATRRQSLLLKISQFSVQQNEIVMNQTLRMMLITKPPKSPKYLIFDNGFNGLADRLKGLMSAYALSLILNRTFLINITSPCDISEYLVPNKINWKIENITRLISVSNFTKINITTSNKQIKWLLKRLVSNKFFSDIDVIYYSSNWAGLIKTLRKLMPEQLEHIDQKKGGMPAFDFENQFAIMFNDLFKLSSRLQEKYDRYRRAMKPNVNVTVICAQIRNNDEMEFRRYNTLSLYWNYIKSNLIGTGNYRLFITSNDEKVIKEALKEFPNERVIITDGEYAHFSEVNQTACHLWEKIVLDFVLLSNCEMAVYGNGGYGKTALLNAKSLRHKKFIQDGYYRRGRKG